jgi:hypothetical protein
MKFKQQLNFSLNMNMNMLQIAIKQKQKNLWNDTRTSEKSRIAYWSMSNNQIKTKEPLEWHTNLRKVSH